MAAYFGYGAWHLHLPPRARLWLVSERHSYRSQHQLGPAQCHRLDEESPFSLAKGLAVLHCHGYSLLALLGVRNLCEFHLFQQYQQDLPEDSAIGAVVSVRYSLCLDPSIPWTALLFIR
jgi:hypothetical protein